MSYDISLTQVLVALVVGYLLRWLVYERRVRRCSGLRYGCRCGLAMNHPGPHKTWIGWGVSPTGIGHTEYWHDGDEERPREANVFTGIRRS